MIVWMFDGRLRSCILYYICETFGIEFYISRKEEKLLLPIGSYDIKLDDVAYIVHPMDEMSTGRDGVEEYINVTCGTM